MAKNEAKVKFTAETGDFNDQIAKANTEMSKLRAEMKYNAEQMKDTGTTVEGLEQKHKLLSQQLEASKQKTEALAQKVEKAKEIYGENSEEVKKLEIQLANAKTSELKLERQVNACNLEIKQQKEAAEKTETATEKLTRTISEQEDELSKLKSEYVEAVLKFGSASKEAKQLAGKIDDLSGELSTNKKRMSEAENSADSFGKELDDVEGGASKFGETLKTVGGTVAKGFVAGVGVMATAVAGGITAFLGTAEATREYRENLSKLQTGFQTSGKTVEQATEVYKGFFSILGEEDRSVEAVNHLAQLTNSQEDLTAWTDICAGVWGTFGDSLPIEGLTEASNETAKVGFE